MNSVKARPAIPGLRPTSVSKPEHYNITEHDTPPSLTDMAAVSEPALVKSFTLFPLLPTELRLKVWKFTLPGPRILELRYDKKHAEFISVARLPRALFICKESREETLKHYDFSFGIDEGSSKVLVDFSVDILLLNCKSIPYTLMSRKDPDGFWGIFEKRRHFQKIKALTMCCSSLRDFIINEMQKKLSLEKMYCLDSDDTHTIDPRECIIEITEGPMKRNDGLAKVYFERDLGMNVVFWLFEEG